MSVNDDPDFLSPLKVAEVQLERALHLFLRESDYVCAITLAAAAEEILGKLLEAAGGTSALRDLIDQCIDTGLREFDVNWKTKEFSEVFTYPRNELKHLAREQSVGVSRQSAGLVLGRAISNYESLVGRRTTMMSRFMEENSGM